MRRQSRSSKHYLESRSATPLVVVADDDIVKVHVHTNDPGLAIQKALTYGSLSRMKIDNMREEHQEKLIKDSERLAAQQKAEEEAKEKHRKNHARNMDLSPYPSEKVLLRFSRASALTISSRADRR